MGSMDALIAATAMVHDMALATLNPASILNG